MDATPATPINEQFCREHIIANPGSWAAIKSTAATRLGVMNRKSDLVWHEASGLNPTIFSALARAVLNGCPDRSTGITCAVSVGRHA